MSGTGIRVIRKRLLDILHFGHAGKAKMTNEVKTFCWPEINKDNKNTVKDCTACLTTGENLNFKLPKKQYGQLKKLTEQGQELHIDFTRKHHKININRDVKILIAVDRFILPKRIESDKEQPSQNFEKPKHRNSKLNTLNT